MPCRLGGWRDQGEPIGVGRGREDDRSATELDGMGQRQSLIGKSCYCGNVPSNASINSPNALFIKKRSSSLLRTTSGL